MRTITLKSNGIGRYDDVSPFLVESSTLELKFNLPNFHGQFFLVTELNGKNGGTKQIPKEGTVKLTGLEAGELKAEVKHYLRGELIETYKVEPLLLKAVDTNLSATPEIALLTAEGEIMREELNAIEEWQRRAKEQADEMNKRNHRRDVAFLAFAYAEYQNDLQLNAKSLSFKEFASSLGYPAEEFSPDEIETIKNFKEAL